MEGAFCLHVQLTPGTFAEWMNKWMGMWIRVVMKVLQKVQRRSTREDALFPLPCCIKCQSHLRESAFSWFTVTPHLSGPSIHFPPAPSGVWSSWGQHDDEPHGTWELSEWSLPTARWWKSISKLSKVDILFHKGRALQLPSVGSHLIVFCGWTGSGG